MTDILKILADYPLHIRNFHIPFFLLPLFRNRMVCLVSVSMNFFLPSSSVLPPPNHVYI